ncbi:MAG: polysaccharide deacetylase [Thiohalocapsa sp.]|uniref:polysaccharide deacetylase n=1 Tax=Thiohalocapsa sp. TaxID=2497641 RepID=UPI0025F6B88B|nr:polysaccharide deacetylase [Thiohalocapsa sp.]MCG6940749.1 polysaccharide deacetylase [Thiohalocapsa sp.]
MTDQPIDVCLTVDVEFTVNNSLTHPDRAPLGTEWIDGVAGGHSHGLGFLLDCLDRHGLKGTFFTEVFNTYHFGDEPMADIIRRIQARGQDVQLHLHPVWLYFKFSAWREALSREPQPRDIFTDRAEKEIGAWLEDGAGILERLAGKRPIAFRSGNLNVGRVLYAGMRRAGIRLASNIGVGLSDPAEPELRFYAGLQRIDGVTEVPVTTYRAPLPGNRLLLLTATGSAFAEMRAVLNAAHRRRIGPVVVLLHPHDFRMALPNGHDCCLRYRPDSVRQSRLERLCAFLAAHPERFRVTTFAEAAERWHATAVTDNPLLRGSVGGLGTRLIENKLLPGLRGLPQ